MFKLLSLLLLIVSFSNIHAVPNSFNPGEKIEAAKLNENFNSLKEKILVVGKGVNNLGGSGQILTDGVSNILWVINKDDSNVWNDGGAYFEVPANKEMVLSISGSIMLNSSIRRFISIYKGPNSSNLTHFQNCSNRNNTEDIVSFNCKLYVTGGEVFALRLNGGDGQLHLTSTSEVYHHLLIHEE